MRSGFGAGIQLANLALKQGLVFAIERGNVPHGMLNLPGKTKEGDAVSLIGP